MKKIFLLCLAVLFCTSIMAQNSVSLKMNPEKNKVYRFSSSSKQIVVQTVNGNQQTVDSKAAYAISLKMIDATADYMVAEVHFDTLKTITNSMGKTVIISSDSTGNIKSTLTPDVMSCIMNRLSKNALYVKIDYAGKPFEIVNSKMLSDIILKDTSSMTLSGPVATAVKKQMTELISDKTLKITIGMFTYFLPGKQVAPGDSWSITVKTSSGGMMLDIITTYHLDGINGNTANITAESNIKATENADPIESGGAKVTYDDIKGLSKSNMAIDTRTGLIIEDKGKTHITGNLGISAPGLSMQIPMDINGESKVIALQ
ncbi:MAG: DUF6263 family protein [Bacteroidales bacterium]